MAETPFRVLTIRSAGTTAQSALYPLLSSKSAEIVAWEELDGTGQLVKRYCRASGVTVSQIISGAERPVVRIKRLKINAYVTAGRLVVACERYRTVSAWAIAGPGAGFGATGVSRAGASRRLQGSVLVGHIRYPWVRSVSPRPRKWRYGRDAIVIEFPLSPKTPMQIRLDLRLRRRGLTPAAVAAEICRRSADYWMTHYPDMPLDVQERLKELRDRARVDEVQPDPGRAGTYQFPTWFPVTPAVPFLRRPRRSSPAYGGDDAGAE